MRACTLSHFGGVRLFATPWTVACQASLSVGFSRQEYWSGLPCPPPGDLSDPGIGPSSLMSPALAGGFSTTSVTWDDVQNSGENYYWFIINIKDTIQEHLNARDAQGKVSGGSMELPCPLWATHSAPRCVHQPTWSVLKGFMEVSLCRHD